MIQCYSDMIFLRRGKAGPRNGEAQCETFLQKSHNGPLYLPEQAAVESQGQWCLVQSAAPGSRGLWCDTVTFKQVGLISSQSMDQARGEGGGRAVPWVRKPGRGEESRSSYYDRSKPLSWAMWLQFGWSIRSTLVTVLLWALQSSLRMCEMDLWYLHSSCTFGWSSTSLVLQSNFPGFPKKQI